MFGIYLPNGFWTFSISIQIATMFAYGFVNIDKIFVLKLGELYQLGLYQAVISIWMLIDFFPQMLYRVLVPMFSSYIALNNKEAIKKGYQLIERYCIFISITIGFFVISFAKELLSFFGDKFVENYFSTVGLDYI